MDKNEFSKRISLIDSLRVEANKYKNEFVNQLNNLNNNSSDSVKTLETRDEKFYNYLINVSEFNYSDRLTNPSDVFPGIRTISQMIDPEELTTKANEMKDAVSDIDNANSLSLLQTKQVISNLRQALSAFSEYMNRSNQIYDLELELLNDLDSIYDISDLKKSTSK